MTSELLRGLYLMHDEVFQDVYGPESQAAIERYVRVEAPQVDADGLRSHPEWLEGVDVLLASWGCPTIDADLLARAPRLRAVFYAAGSVRALVSQAAWDRGLVVVSAKDAIAERVAEFTTSVIYLSLKHFWSYERQAWQDKHWPQRRPVPGTVGTRVGIVSLGSVGRRVAERVASSALEVVAYDPYCGPEAFGELGCRPVDLAEMFSTSDVVSLHAPLGPETEGMVGGAFLSSMKDGATLVNTARGGLVDHVALASVLNARPDLTAVLDVTDPEPLPAGSELFGRANVVITPHIAGNVSLERRALGRAIAEEVRRFSLGEPLRWAVTASQLAHSA
jgi:phosphoglycerate dehydrogenase-like enzyme